MNGTGPWLHRRGTLARGGWQTVVDSAIPGWRYTGLRVAELRAGRGLVLPAEMESIVVPLRGRFHVVTGDTITRLAGRDSVFDGPSDVAYVPPSTGAVLEGEGRVAVASAPTGTGRAPRHIRADEVPIELRGAGDSSRQVHNFGTPEVLDADRLIVCEVITPAGNWSSYPPHKHDELVPGHESRLEEIYYFEVRPANGGTATDGFGIFSAYASTGGVLEINAMVHTGDVALVPFGYHGPAVAAPGYDLYYLNVMAGPDTERAWLVTDDPAHGWVRDTWRTQPVDPRLPFTTRTGATV